MGRTDAGITRARLVDGGLAAGVLAVVLAVTRRRGRRVRPDAAIAGGVGAMALEWVLGHHAATVRRYWAAPSVKAGSVAGLGLLVVGGRRIDEERTLSAVTGGLVAYLALLVLVSAGVVPAPNQWRRRTTGRSDR